MEIELRVILLIVGVVILLVVAIDLYRRRLVKDFALDTAIADVDLPASREPTRDYYNRIDLDDVVVEQDYVALDSGMPYHDDPIPDLNYDFEPEYVEPEYIEQEQPEVLKPTPTNIISITLKSRNRQGFKGSDLLYAIKNAHLHFSENNVFERYIDERGEGEVLFTLVKAVEPGYFYIETLAQEYVPGVTLILIPEQTDNPHMAFDKLIRTAKQMAFSLNAELLDHERKPLTLETISHYNKQAQQK